MHIKFNRYGKGSAAIAAQYIIQLHDSKGTKREQVTVLRGNPVEVALVADSLSFSHRYTSGVIAFAPEDKPSNKELEEVLKEFEKTAWAGLEPDRYSWSATLHRESNGSCHIHIFAARVDLETNKSLNIAPPGWRNTFAALRDWLNLKNDWARPDEISRQRLVQKAGHEYYQNAAALRQGLETEENPREIITAYLEKGILSGQVKDRKTILEALHRAGLETPRAGKNYITVKGAGHKWRLKGAIYEQSWTAEKTVGRAVTEGLDRGASQDEDNIRRAYKECCSKRDHRRKYNLQRYKKPDAIVLDKSADIRINDLHGYLDWKLGGDALPESTDSISSQSETRKSDITQSVTKADLGDRINQNRNWQFYSFSGGDKGGDRMGDKSKTSNQNIKLRKLNDRIGNNIVARIRRINRTIQEGKRTATSGQRTIEQGLQQLATTGKQLAHCVFWANKKKIRLKNELEQGDDMGR